MILSLTLAITIFSFIGIPPLIGFFLRRAGSFAVTVYFSVNVSGDKGTGLIELAIANELQSAGSMNSGKQESLGFTASTRSVDWHTNMEQREWITIGKLAQLFLTNPDSVRGKQTEAQYEEVDAVARNPNARTGGIHTVYEDLATQKHQKRARSKTVTKELNTGTSRCGNSFWLLEGCSQRSSCTEEREGNPSLSTFPKQLPSACRWQSIEGLKMSERRVAFSTEEYARTTLSNGWIRVRTLVASEVGRTVRYHSSGGKIAEKAKVSGNAENSGETRGASALVPLTSAMPLGARTLKSGTEGREDQDLSESGGSPNATELKWPKGKELMDILEEVHKKQMKIVEEAEKFGLQSKQVHRLQEIMAKSWGFRVAAVQHIATQRGSQTAGVDGETLSVQDRDEDKLAVVEWLKEWVDHPNEYKASPVKRVYIPKANGKQRPLGIPTIRDRTLQSLINHVLLPLVELTSDEQSYGYRPYRSAKNALGEVRQNLMTGSEYKWILDADIKGFFDNINHDWILDNVMIPPKYKPILDSWLKGGTVYRNTFSETETGTPQGGIISPTLANLTLNGLEKVVLKSIWPITKSKDQRMKIKPSKLKRSQGPEIITGNKNKKISLGVQIVRYADDFVVIARSKHIIVKYIRPKVEEFLSQRGLILSPEKTKLITLRDETAELNFLGYSLKYKKRWTYKRSLVKEHIEQSAIALLPQRRKIIAFNRALRKIIRENQNKTAYELIAQLNPKIRGFANYYNIGNASKYLDYVRQALYQLTWKWAKRKHPKWGRKSIAEQYFLRLKPEGRRKKNDISSSTLIHNVRWVFRGITKETSHYKESQNKGYYIYLLSPTGTSHVLAALKYRMSSELTKIHAFHRKYMKLIEYSSSVNIMAMAKNPSFKDKLMKRQNGKCEICGNALTTEQIANGQTHIHHVTPVHRKGARSDVRNMQLLHSWCHREVEH